MSEYSWSRTDREGHENTLPADNWYHRHQDISVHAHVYCRPVLTFEADQPYAVAMLSFATHNTDSGLVDLIRQLNESTDLLDVRGECDRAAKMFETALDRELRYHTNLAGEDDDATD
jgi:hypothetical protein